MMCEKFNSLWIACVYVEGMEQRKSLSDVHQFLYSYVTVIVNDSTENDISRRLKPHKNIFSSHRTYSSCLVAIQSSIYIKFSTPKNITMTIRSIPHSNPLSVLRVLGCPYYIISQIFIIIS